MKLNPSRAHVWMPCPGSVQMEENVPKEESSESAKEGIIAHEAAAMTFFGQDRPAHDDEMDDAIKLYVDHVMSITGNPRVEEYLHCPSIHMDCGGKPDAWAFVDKTGEVHIWDFKYGHRFVEVEENPQMSCFVEDITSRIEGRGLKVKAAYFHIVQPRAYGSDPIRTWKYDREVVDTIRNLQISAKQAQWGDAPLNPGGHCSDCRARRKCPALQESAYNIVAITETLFERELTVEQSARELTVLTGAAKLLKDRIESLVPVVQTAVMGGASGLGWVMEPGRGSVVWTHPYEELIALGLAMGVDVSKPAVVTPTQAIKAGMDANLVEAYSKRVAGTPSLKPFKPVSKFK